MRIQIYYFSGTGNTLHVAKELAAHLPEAELVPIVHCIKESNYTVQGDVVGFVFPLHGMTLPVPVRMFLQKATFTSNPYIFGLTTRGGTKVFAFEKMMGLLKRKNQILDASCILTMWGNDPKLKDYEDPSQADIAAMEKDVQAQIESFANTINQRNTSLVDDSDYITFDFPKPITYLMEQLILFGMWTNTWHNVRDYFEADEKCVGCGVCEYVCLSGKIRMNGDKPVWQDDKKCYFCYTCLNYCPTQAIQIKDKPYMKSFTPDKGRYPHPFATKDEIVEQK